MVAVSASGGTSAEEENGVSDSAEPREGASGAGQSVLDIKSKKARVDEMPRVAVEK